MLLYKVALSFESHRINERYSTEQYFPVVGAVLYTIQSGTYF